MALSFEKESCLDSGKMDMSGEEVGDMDDIVEE